MTGEEIFRSLIYSQSVSISIRIRLMYIVNIEITINKCIQEYTHAHLK